MFVSVTLGPPGAFFTQCVFVCVLVCISYSVCKLECNNEINGRMQVS